MSEKISKAKFLQDLQAGRAEWDALLAEVDPARMEEPDVEGEWSVKDIIAHVTWGEREMVGVLRARALVGSDLWDLPTQDERNAAVYEEVRRKPLSDVLTESHEVYRQLLEAAQALPEQALNDPGQFTDMPAHWVPWQ